MEHDKASQGEKYGKRIIKEAVILWGKCGASEMGGKWRMSLDIHNSMNVSAFTDIN